MLTQDVRPCLTNSYAYTSYFFRQPYSPTFIAVSDSANEITLKDERKCLWRPIRIWNTMGYKSERLGGLAERIGEERRAQAQSCEARARARVRSRHISIFRQGARSRCVALRCGRTGRTTSHSRNRGTVADCDWWTVMSSQHRHTPLRSPIIFTSILEYIRAGRPTH